MGILVNYDQNIFKSDIVFQLVNTFIFDQIRDLILVGKAMF